MVTERYADGKIKIERQVTQDSAGNYVNDGTYTMYDPHGQVARSGQFQNGKQTGKWIQHFSKDLGCLFACAQDNSYQGPFTSEATFADGRLNGAWTITDRNGQNIVQWNFELGIPHGLWTWWYSNGHKRSEKNYTNGALNGSAIEYDREGKQIGQKTYVGGLYLAKVTESYAPGEKHFEGFYLRVEHVTQPSYDWWNSAIKPGTAMPGGSDQQHGTWVAWYRNGMKLFEGQYDHGVPTGKFTWFYPNSQQQAEAEYQNGIKSGTWITWHTNGQKESEGQFTEGRLIGKWTHWDADGKVVEVQEMNGKTAKPASLTTPVPNNNDTDSTGQRISWSAAQPTENP